MFNDVLLTSPATKCKASSVLNKSSQYAAKHMFDENLDSCWNSDQGIPQILVIDFERIVSLSFIKIMFQGGFVGADGIIEVCSRKEDSFEKISEFHNLFDSNAVQTIPIASSDARINCRYVRITFTSSSDFYGRIVVYSLNIFGQISA